MAFLCEIQEPNLEVLLPHVPRVHLQSRIPVHEERSMTDNVAMLGCGVLWTLFRKW